MVEARGSCVHNMNEHYSEESPRVETFVREGLPEDMCTNLNFTVDVWNNTTIFCMDNALRETTTIRGDFAAKIRKRTEQDYKKKSTYISSGGVKFSVCMTYIDFWVRNIRGKQHSPRKVLGLHDAF